MFNELAAKHTAKHSKHAGKAQEKHLIPGAKPVSQAEFKVPFSSPPCARWPSGWEGPPRQNNTSKRA